ncbi:UvrD-helicase domain-containing protein [Sphingobacterium sp. SRCM116780]|uniref:UvrD-helicase domain-containing protein n=1 Tax=Sphingobacterium sp. SRCM116780 TaxID=2907623 RepID=UPI001F2D204C|nr:UvrD-helicase domain-containing protein [Sphingobacterium sp. SRCM116780]UIR56130.1 UvrD-helicase domain-containing protein [Sphingobacterium sp. SRCM116780]
MNNIAPLKILKASAGSGKTFSLTVHYLTLLLSKENSYREILAVTFTNKATAEMKERILSVLKGLAQGDPSKKINDYRLLLLKQFSNWDAGLIQEKAYRVYRKILHDYSHFTISTIDGFSQKVIRSFTYELHLDAAYKIEMNTSKVRQDLTVMLNHLLDKRPDLLEWIIEYAEKKIANNENWNYRRELTNLANEIFSENFKEFDKFLLSQNSDQVFNKLNKEIETFIRVFLEALQEEVKKFEGAFKSLNLDAADLKGKSRNPIYTLSHAQVNVFKLSTAKLEEIINKYVSLIGHDDAFLDGKKEINWGLQQAILPILGNFKLLADKFRTYITYEAFQKNFYYLRLLKEMSDLLAQWRKENNAQLISDAQIQLNKLGLDQHGDPTFIWEKIGNRYQYFLFDEFQDTSRIQWKNYSPLLINALGNASGKLAEHLIVGDVKQSIYRWRNGDWRILLEQAEKQVANSFHISNEEDLKELIENGSLDINYRSLPNIIHFNNYLFETIPQQIQQLLNEHIEENLTDEGKNWWKEMGYDHMIMKAYEGASQQIPEEKIYDESKKGSITIKYLPVENNIRRNSQVEPAAVEALCQQIHHWLATGRYQANQIGILVRSNKQARLVIHELMNYRNEHHLQFEVISGDALALEANEGIQLLIETLKAFVFNTDKHILYKARFTHLYHIIQKGKNFDDEIWLKFKDNDVRNLQGDLPKDLIDNWDNWQKLPLVHLVEKLIEAFGLTSQNNPHIPYILAFKDMIANFSSNGERGINQFLTFWDEDGTKAVLPSSGKIEAIEVTTVHKSKGLAYDVVMIPFCSWTLDGMTNGNFWIDTEETALAPIGKAPIKYTATLGQSTLYRKYYEEMVFNYMDALNTFYVATTRAIEHIYISAPAFKQLADRKTGEILGMDIKNDLIGDIVYQSLMSNKNQFGLTENELNMDCIIVRESEDKIEIGKIALQQYPISKELDKAFEKSSQRTINSILLLDKASQYGVMAHEIMSIVTSKDEIEPTINQYIAEGIFTAEEKSAILHEVNQIWQHPQINRWLVGDFKIWNESGIITAKGETLRPDKVFTSENETIVLDFKFTQNEALSHQKQVNQYVNTLAELGYKNVKGFLFYAKSNDLVEVVSHVKY